MTTYFVTGGAGFIGSHFCRKALELGWCKNLVNLDALTYAGNPDNLETISNSNQYRFIGSNLLDTSVGKILETSQPDVIIHFAAESHVDRSIEDPSLFLKTNILGSFHLLDAVRKSPSAWAKKVRFLFVSTDEVYGALGATGQFFENTPFAPRSPYSVSKAAADMLTQAYFHTYKLDVVVVRCSNNYGPNQFPEKLIPQTTIFAIEDKKIPVYGKGDNVRDWIFVHDFVRGIQAAILKGKTGEAYNFGGASERKNIDVVKNILTILKKPESLIEFVEDRKGHDFRYAVNFEKSAKDLNWKPEVAFEAGLKETVHWYRDNSEWWKRIQSGEYLGARVSDFHLNETVSHRS
jgi:dTDP-glucose 4,6-dehydratase